VSDEAALAAAHSASLCPREATLTFKGCGHARRALSGPTRAVEGLCRDCLRARGTFKEERAFIVFCEPRRNP